MLNFPVVIILLLCYYLPIADCFSIHFLLSFSLYSPFYHFLSLCLLLFSLSFLFFKRVSFTDLQKQVFFVSRSSEWPQERRRLVVSRWSRHRCKQKLETRIFCILKLRRINLSCFSMKFSMEKLIRSDKKEEDCDFRTFSGSILKDEQFKESLNIFLPIFVSRLSHAQIFPRKTLDFFFQTKPTLFKIKT